MTQVLHVHPTHPQPRLVKQAAALLGDGGVVVYPTDTSYALACHIGDKPALERIVAIRQLGRRHRFTLACRDLSELGVYARVDNVAYRLLKRCTPGPYTFVLKASRDVPKRLLHEKRRTIGLRVPANAIAQMLLELMGEPILTTSLRLPGEKEPLTDSDAILDAIGSQIDLIVDGGTGGTEPSTVVDLTGPAPEILRTGIGDVSLF